MDCFWGFLLGFIVCGVGIILALVFDYSFDQAERGVVALFRKIFNLIKRS